MLSTYAGLQQKVTAANIGDPYFNYVVLLCHGNGADLSTTVVDSSTVGRTLTCAGNAKLSTSSPKFGSASISFGNVSSIADRVTSAAAADLCLTGDFTFECQFKTNNQAQNGQYFFVLQDGSSNNSFFIGWSTSVVGKFSVNFRISDGTTFRIDSLAGISSGTWYQIGVKLSGTTLSFYVDTVLQGTATVTGTRYLTNMVAWIGSPISYGLNGKIDELRLTNGVARDLTAVQTAEFPSVGGSLPNPTQKCNPRGSLTTQFSVVAVSSAFGITGTPMGTVTLATVTSTDGSLTAVVMDEHGDIANIPGLTFNYSGGALTVSGTPTGHSKIYSIGVCYRSSDGTGRAVGSSMHDITIANAADVLTIGNMNAASIKVGVPSTTVLLSPSSNYPTGLKAIPATNVPGMSVVLAWSTGATPSGTVSLTGTPTVAGAYTLNIDYYTPDGTVKLGSSTHVVNVAESYVTPPAPPAPVPGPPPPAPAPPPAPPPAPQPGHGPDQFFSSVKALLHFNDSTNVASDQIAANSWTNDQVSYVSGAILGGGGFASSSKLSCAIVGAEGLSGLLTVELMFDIDSVAWDALTADGTDFRWCPISCLVAQDGSVLWALGLFSYYSSYYKIRQTRAGFYMPLLSLPGDQTFVQPFGPVIPARPNKFMHLAGAIKPRPGGVGFGHVGCVWLNGDPGLGSSLFLASRRVTKTGRTVLIGGSDGSIPAYYGGQSNIVNFSGKIDEYRLTAEARYASYMDFTALAIPEVARTIPWSNS